MLAAASSLAVAIASPARAQLTAGAYEHSPTVTLDEVLPPRLQQSGHHRVSEEIVVRGTMLAFHIESDQGDYQVLSLPMVVVRVYEILILAQAVDDFQRSNEKLAAQLRGVMQGGDAWSSQIRTDSSLVKHFTTQELGNAFKELGDIGDPKARQARSKQAPVEQNVYETYQPEDPVLASHKRSVAAQLGLDVYSSNPRVQTFLDTLAYARSSGNRNAGMAMVSLPRGVEVRIDDGRIENRVRGIMARDTIRQVYQRNEATLAAAGVAQELIDPFLTLAAFSPRHKTEIAEHLVFLEGVGNRGALLVSAMLATSEADAQEMVWMARMLAYYHQSVARLDALSASASVVLATTADKGLAVFLPFDLIHWNEQTDQVFSRLGEIADDRGLANRDLVLGGVVSETAARQLGGRGFRLRPRFLFLQ